MERRNFIKTTLLLSETIFASEEQKKELLNFPGEVYAIVNGQNVALSGNNGQI